MRPQIYYWSEDFFCDGCLIYAMIPHHPWNQWAIENDVSDFSTAEALHDIAAFFHLNRRSHQDRADMGFPELARPDQLQDSTLFCAVCLTLLHQVP